MTDPATRESSVTDPAAREWVARGELQRIGNDARYWAAERRAALWDLKEALGTWQKVADATGQTQPAVYKAAMQPHKKGTTP